MLRYLSLITMPIRNITLAIDYKANVCYHTAFNNTGLFVIPYLSLITMLICATILAFENNANLCSHAFDYKTNATTILAFDNKANVCHHT